MAPRTLVLANFSIIHWSLFVGILQEIVASALALIQHRQGDVSATEIAQLFCVSARQSRFYLARVTGKNLRTLCLEARLAPARSLVRDTNRPIDALARAFGYAQRAKFDVSYEQVYQATPAADRVQARRTRAKPLRRVSHQAPNPSISGTATQGVDQGLR